MLMKLRLIGRHIYKDNKDYFSFSGSGFEFEVSHFLVCNGAGGKGFTIKGKMVASVVT